MSIVLWVSIFWGLILHTTLTQVDLLSFGLPCGKWTLLCHFLHVFSNPGTGGEVCCTLSWSMPVHPSWLGLCIPLFFLQFSSWYGLPLVPLRLFIFWGLCNQNSCAYVCYYFFRCVHLKHFGWIFESYHMVDSLSAWSGIILVCNGYFHSGVNFWCFIHFWYHMGFHLWCIHFYFPYFHFWKNFIFLGVTAEFLLGWKF